MQRAYYRRATCRLCAGLRLREVLSLCPTPPANEFVGQLAVGQPQTKYPLDVHLCEECGHLQLVDVVDPAVLFRNYLYVSGTSPVFVEHFRRYALTMVERFDLRSSHLAVDIGSNDGVLLKALQAHGLAVLGVDPARDIAALASADGIPTWTEFFSSEVGHRILAEKGRAHLVTANNVFAHSDALEDIADGVGAILAPQGVFVFEVSYLADVYEKNLFDTIYHEHLAYHSVRPLLSFFEVRGLHVFDAERVDTHGGSIRVYVQTGRGGRERSERLLNIVADEEALGLFDPQTYVGWGDRIKQHGKDLRGTLEAMRAQGKRIAGFGAPAKATTLMHQFGVDKTLVEFIIDDSPLKQGLYSPGLHLPVLAPSALGERAPECLLILAWNFADSIIARHGDYIANGGTFIVPLPELRIVSAS